jgi:hypothetical protein
MPDTRNEATAAALAVSQGCPAQTDHDREVPEVDLLSPLTIRRV